MHPIDFLGFDRSKLTPREAQFLEALLWLAGEMPCQLALQLGQSPEQKSASVAAAKAKGHRVAMIGDGLNDATALASSDLSVAACDAQDVNRVSADVQLLRPGIVPLVALFGIARTARRRMWENIIWSVAYNLVGVALAVTGHLHPAVAAALMFGSSLFVLWNSVRWANLRSG
jgi:Cu+-exporting ATPase